ncbi:MAG: glycosyltransferase family 4 protein [Bacillota bacterium]
MKVCIIRNAEPKSNAGMLRIIDALIEGNHQPCILSRTRDVNKKSKKIEVEKLVLESSTIVNYNLILPSDTGRGLRNIFQLLVYQTRILIWLLLNKNKFDAIHAFDLDAGLPASIISKCFKKPLVYHIADFYADSRPGIPKIFKKFVVKLEYLIISIANVTIICTEERIEQIKGSKPNKLRVIHNSPVISGDLRDKSSGIYIENFGGRTNKNLKLCYVGNLEERRFIKAILNIVSKDERLHLDIAGGGNLQDYVKEVANAHNNINYLGRVEYKDALELYTTCDIMFAVYDPTVPNHRFSAPNKVYESMMLGKPIIVAKNTGIDNLVEKEEIGLSIDYSEESFGKAINTFIDNPENIIKMGLNAENISRRYSWDSMKKEIMGIYENLKI